MSTAHQQEAGGCSTMSARAAPLQCARHCRSIYASLCWACFTYLYARLAETFSATKPGPRKAPLGTYLSLIGIPWVCLWSLEVPRTRMCSRDTAQAQTLGNLALNMIS